MYTITHNDEDGKCKTVQKPYSDKALSFSEKINFVILITTLSKTLSISFSGFNISTIFPTRGFYAIMQYVY